MVSEARKHVDFLNRKLSASERLINLKGTIVKSLAPCSLAIALAIFGQQAFADEPAKTTANPGVTSGGTTTPGSAIKKANPSDLFMVELKGNADRDSFDSALKDMHGTLVDTIKMGPLTILVVQAEPGTAAETQKKLSSSNEVKAVQRNTTYRLNQAPDDVLFSTQWDLTFMQYANARPLGLNNNGLVFMYFLDTGFNPTFGETTPLVRQYDFSRPWFPSGDLETPHDSGFHGTSTATVLCDTDNFFGFAGMSNWEGQRTSLTELRISQDGETANGLNIVYALQFLYGQFAAGGFPAGPVNLSFGQSPPFTLNAAPLIQDIAQLLQQQGSLLVLAAGNDGVEDPSAELFARRVASISQDGQLSSFSEFGPFNAAAPGDMVPCYEPMNGAQGGLPVFISGTSFAAPRWCSAIVNVMAALPASKRNAHYADQIVIDTGTVTNQKWIVPNLLAALQLAQAQK
jgi:subtilisin family serine protease